MTGYRSPKIIESRAMLLELLSTAGASIKYLKNVQFSGEVSGADRLLIQLENLPNEAELKPGILKAEILCDLAYWLDVSTNDMALLDTINGFAIPPKALSKLADMQFDIGAIENLPDELARLYARADFAAESIQPYSRENLILPDMSGVSDLGAQLNSKKNFLDYLKVAPDFTWRKNRHNINPEMRFDAEIEDEKVATVIQAFEKHFLAELYGASLHVSGDNAVKNGKNGEFIITIGSKSLVTLLEKAGIDFGDRSTGQSR